MSLKLGVSLYSMTNEWLAGRFSLTELIDEVGRQAIGPGVEVIGFQSLRGFPHSVDESDLRALQVAMERNELEPTSLGSNADIALKADAWMDTDQSVEYMRPQIELAARLGFPVVRIQIGLTPAVLEKLEPIAAKARVHLGMEIHAPESPNTPKVLAIREVYRRIDSEYLGFVPDFSACMRAIPSGMIASLQREGLSQAGAEALDRAWKTPGAPFERYTIFAREAKELGEPDLPVSHARLVFTMFGRESAEDWREILPLVRHIHGKFYEIENGESPSIDYEKIIRVFSAANHTMTMSSEWEAHAFMDVNEQSAFDIVRQHHDMCRALQERLSATT